MTLGMILLQGPRRVVFLMSEVPLQINYSTWRVGGDYCAFLSVAVHKLRAVPGCANLVQVLPRTHNE
jgi:hypothetical protein